MLGPGFEGRRNGHFRGVYQIKRDDHICWCSSLHLGMPRMNVSSRSPEFSTRSDCREGSSWERSGVSLWVTWGERSASSLGLMCHHRPSSHCFLLSPHAPCINSCRSLLCLVSHPEFLPEGFLHGGCLVSRSGLCFQTTFQHLWEWRHGKSDVSSSSVGTRRWQELRRPGSWLLGEGCWGRPHLSAVFFL